MADRDCEIRTFSLTYKAYHRLLSVHRIVDVWVYSKDGSLGQGERIWKTHAVVRRAAYSSGGTPSDMVRCSVGVHPV